MNVLEVFTGNPFNTPVGQRIEKATDGSLEAADWALNIEICDIINETDEGPKEAVRAIRKKISNSVGKDWRAVTYCLTVLETCVKNCGRRFHIQLASKDFLHELVKIISPKNEPTVLVQEKILSLIQSWADAFRGVTELRAVESIYQELKGKGIEFPSTDPDQLAPIHTPKGHPDSPVRSATTVPHVTPTHTPARAGQYAKLDDEEEYTPSVTQPAVAMSALPSPPPQGGTADSSPVTAEQMSKLRADIDIVQGNCRVLNEMLNVATSGSEMSSDTMDLMRELSRTCKQMQQRVVVLIEKLADEQVTEVLLRVNDDLNNAFLRYDRLERSRNAPASAAPPNYPAVASSTPPAAAQPAQQSLIDFGGSEPPAAAPQLTASALAAHVDSMSLTSGTNISNISDVSASSPSQPQAAGTDEFDVFAQSRQQDASQHGTAAPASTADSDATGLSVTSSEFDQFLSERVAAGDKLPERKPDADGSSRPTPTSRNGGGRQMPKDDSENALFAL